VLPGQTLQPGQPGRALGKKCTTFHVVKFSRMSQIQLLSY
jgi:hypothetical protein